MIAAPVAGQGQLGVIQPDGLVIQLIEQVYQGLGRLIQAGDTLFQRLIQQFTALTRWQGFVHGHHRVGQPIAHLHVAGDLIHLAGGGLRIAPQQPGEHPAGAFHAAPVGIVHPVELNQLLGSRHRHGLFLFA